MQGINSRRWTWAVVILAAVVGSALLLAAPSAAQAGNTPTPSPSLDEKAPFYDNNSSSVDNRSWTYGHRDPTLANVSHYLTRFGGFVVGDERAQGGGFAGPMVVGMVLVGAVLSAGSGAAIGPVAGVVVAVEVITGLVAVALAPTWIYPIVILALGGTVLTTIFRVFR